MKALLKAEFRKLFKGKIVYILLALSVIIPTFSVLGMVIILKLIGEAASMPPVLGALLLYFTSFSPLNNIGFFLLLAIIIVGANDFKELTIRNKIIAGHKKHNIFLSSLILNLSIVFVIMLVYSTLNYVYASIGFGFSAEVFYDVFKAGIIGYGAIFVLYSFATLILYVTKGAGATIGIVIGSFFLLIIIDMLFSLIPFDNVEFNRLISYAFPIIRLNSLAGVNLNHAYLTIVSNLVHLAWIIPLGIYVSRHTDYK